MAQLSCPNGHHWSQSPQAGPSDSVCPVCGSRASEPTPMAARQDTAAFAWPKESEDEGTQLVSRPEAAAAKPEARFTILRRHAQGGLGQISLARDETLQRQVALKEIKPQHLSNPEARERFIHEARITGLLEHPGIVPIYALEEDAQGKPYYAMRFLQGKNLAQTIRDYHRQPTSLAFRDLLKRFGDVCQTIAYAHSKGFIHCDLKPANIMLGDFGETLVVDWGLAKQVGRGQGAGGSESEETTVAETGAAKPEQGQETIAWRRKPDEDALTWEGQVVGTPAYMAPEQARCEEVGPPADIFALGAILYETLTNQAPYTGRTVSELLAQARAAKVTPPSQASRGVPPALDRICLKAMARNPGERYASAQALAQDVQRWLADEPVSVYAGSWLERTGRWARRHKAIVAGGVMVLLTSILALGLGLFFGGQERDAKELARQQEEEQRKLAEDREKWAKTNFERAGQAVQELTNVGEYELRNVPKLESVRRKLLEKALEFQLGFLKEKSQDPAVRLQTGRAYEKVARIQNMLGRHQEALQTTQAGIDLAKSLVADHPDEASYQEALADLYSTRSSALIRINRFVDAEAVWKEAKTLREQLILRYPDNKQFGEDLLESFHNRGKMLQELGPPAEAEAAYTESIQRGRRLLEQYPQGFRIRHSLALSLNNLGNVVASQGRVADAEKHLLEACDRFAAIVDDYPKEAREAWHLAVAWSNLAIVHRDMDRPVEAAKSYRKAIRLQANLVDQFRATPEYRHGLAAAQLGLAELLPDLGGSPKETEELIRAGISGWEKLSAEHGLVADYRFQLGKAYNHQAVLWTGQGKLPAAVKMLREAVALQEKLAEDYPKTPLYLGELGRSLDNLANYLDDLGEVTEAEQLWHRALKTLRPLTTQQPKVVLYRYVLANVHNNLGTLLSKQGRRQPALSAFTQAEKEMAEVVRQAPKSPRYLHLRGVALFHLGQALLLDGRTAEGRQALQEGLKLEMHLVKQYPANPAYKTARDQIQKALGQPVLPDPPVSVAGQVLKGNLSADDPLDTYAFTAKSHAKVHDVPLEGGRPYLIDLQGSFDTFLRIEDAKKKQLLFNDDVHPKDLNSRIVFVPPAKESYRLVVTAFEPGATGRYALSVQEAVKAGPPIIVKDTLTAKDPKYKDKHFKTHQIKLAAGAPYTIELDSTGFAAHLGLGDASGKTTFPFNGVMPRFKTIVRMDFTPKTDGEQLFVVSTVRADETGAYTLTVQRYEAEKKK